MSGMNKDNTLLIFSEQQMLTREKAVTKNEAAIASREKVATAREDAAQVREGIADQRDDTVLLREGVAQVRENESQLREESLTLRERELHSMQPTLDVAQDQIQMLQHANGQLVTATLDAQKMTEEIEQSKVQLEHLAHHDVLTGLPNRLLLQDRLGQAIEVARRQCRQLAVMYMDLDRFKYINDSLGHAVGDQLLRSVAQRLVACVRQSDTVSRQGGDEFVLLLPLIEHAEDAALSAQKILESLAQAHHIEGQDLHISVSIGISIYPADAQDAESLLKSADTAMYHAKESGRNTFKFFEQDMNSRAVQRQTIEASLRVALARQEFVLHYQPKINLQSGAIVGVEALIRWQHPTRGLLSPDQFIAVAEDCGLILPIDRWVLREACLQARAWLQRGLPPITIAVNTSATEFRAKDFLDYVREVLAETGLDPQTLELELTESVLMRDAESTDRVLRAIADLGIRLAIDDFGTGYSSLSYLSRFPISSLKIDQSFVKQITNNPNEASIISAVVSMGKGLKLCVIAEGVETPEQMAFLLTQQCDEGQGYLFSRPVTADVLAASLQTGGSLTGPACGTA